MIWPLAAYLAAGAVFLAAWPLIGLGANRLRETANRAQRDRSEVRGVIGRVHGQSNYNNLGAE